MIRPNYVKNKLLESSPVIGIWSIVGSPMVLDIAAHAGLDFQILDMEHGVYDLPSLENCIRACELMNCSPIVRVPCFDASMIQSCLDLGAHGIIIPQLKGYDEVKAAISATKFPPVGSRGFNPFVRAGFYSPAGDIDLTHLNNKFSLTSIIIENQITYNQIDKILTIHELDVIYLGVYDMSFDMGFNGNINHPEILKFVDLAVSKIRACGKYAGVMVGNEEDIIKYTKKGVDFMVYGIDTQSYYTAIKNKVDLFKKVISLK